MIPQIEPWIDNKELIELKKVIKSTFITENYYTKKFEDKIKKYTDSKYAITLSNGTVAQYAALVAMGVKPKDEIIVPNLTFISTATAIIMAGAIPVLCEIKQDTLCIDIFKAQKLVNKKTKAIVPVHLYGQSSDMDSVKLFAKKNKLLIFEDAAQGIGVKFNKKHVGTFGTAGMISFYGNKTITTGQGGIVLTNNKKILKKIMQLKNHGRDSTGTFIHQNIGYNFAFTEMQAAIGISQMKKLPKIIEKKRKINHFYTKKLKKISQLMPIHIDKRTEPVFWFTSFLSNESDKLSKYLLKKNIQTRKFFYPLHMQPCFKKNKIIKNVNSDFSISEKIYRQGISFPSSYGLTNYQMNYIVSCIKNFYENRN